MDKKTVIVTGGVRGIGRAISIYLHDLGYNVIADYKERDDKALELKEMGIDVFKADLTSKSEVEKLIKYVIDKYKKIDCLVNNAGIDSDGLFQDITDEEFDRVIRGNFYTCFATSREVIPHMIKEKDGLIINISSVYGTNGGSYATMYSASKGAIIGLTKALAKEVAPSNIRVNSIAPGAVDTDMTRNLGEEGWNLWLENTPLNRKGTGEDIAKCVEWLLKDSYTTGQIIRVDGGYEI